MRGLKGRKNDKRAKDSSCVTETEKNTAADSIHTEGHCVLDTRGSNL